jgi:uncharacterized protein (TIGR03435 family)
VVSVKLAHPERLIFVGLQEMPDGIRAMTVTTAMMVQSAYGGHKNLPVDDAVAGLPDWAKGDYYAVDAKMSPEQIAQFKTLDKEHKQACRGAMLQALLADRFKLQVHHETRQVLAYELVVDKGGPKFKDGDGSDTNTPIGPDGKRLGNSMQVVNTSSGPEAVVRNFTMEQLAMLLSGQGGVNHRVVDKTGLTGPHNYTLTFALSQGAGSASVAAPAEASDPAPTVFNALQDQIGLKLQRGTETVDTVVVDHVERPAAN